MPEELKNKLKTWIGAVVLWGMLIVFITIFSVSVSVNWVSSDTAIFRAQIAHTFDEIQTELNGKVNEETRKIMLKGVDRRLDDIEARLLAINSKLNLLLDDRRERLSRSKPIPPD
jgi:hypothetical protein